MSMPRGFRTLLIVLAAAANAGLFRAGDCMAQDEVVLKSGDRLTGVVAERSEAMVILDHPTLGRLEIPVEEILRLTIAQEIVIGEAPPPPPDEAAPEPPAEEVTEAVVAPDPDDWKFHLDLGGTGSFGNTDTQAFRISITGLRENAEERTALDVAYFYGATNGDRTTNKVTAGVLQDWFVSDSRWSYFASVRYDFDEFQSWEHRLGAHGGFGYHVVDREDFDWMARAGAGVNKEWKSEEDDLRPEALLSTDINWQIDEHQAFVFATTLYPDLGDLGEYRWITDAKWTMLLANHDNLSLSAGLRNEYQSDVDPGIKHNDLYIFAGLTLDF
jgi:hypothetical protein